jgi:xanthine/uracil permease
METTRWTNPSQPQTLQSSVILLYLNAVLGLVFAFSGVSLVLSGAQVAAGWGCANERRWGYQLGVAVAVLPFLLLFAVNSPSDIFDSLLSVLIALAFDIVLLVLLLHPMTRSYQRIWFR